MVLVGLSVERRHLALAVGVVEGVVDRLRRDAETRCGDTIDIERNGVAAGLLIGDNILNLRQSAKLCEQLVRPLVQLFTARVFHGVLILRAADAVFDREVLHWLQISLDAWNLAKFCLEAVDNFAGADATLVQRFEVDLHAPAVERGVGAIDTDKR